MDIYPSVSEGLVKNDLPREDTTETHNAGRKGKIK